MTTITLTPEQHEAVKRAGDQPVRVEDPVGHCVYRLVEEDALGMVDATEPRSQTPFGEIPEEIRRSQAAFLRDLPELLKDRSLRGQWVMYHGDERIGIAPDEGVLIRECFRRGLERDQYDAFIIEETEEVDYPSAWLP